MLVKIITGGQTGADAGALRAARGCGVETGGWAATGFQTEHGPDPTLVGFGLVAAPDADYATRTRMNTEEAHAGLWFGNPASPGGKCTIRSWERAGVGYYVALDRSTPADVAEWLRDYAFPGREDGVVLHVAGNRESKAPGIAARVERFVAELIDELGNEVRRVR